MILMSWRFESCMTQDSFSPLRVTWEVNFAENCGHNSYLLICDNFGVQVPAWYDAEGTFLIMGHWIARFFKNLRHSWNCPLYEDFAIGSTFWKFTPCTTQDKVSLSWWHENLIVQKVLEATTTSCFAMTFCLWYILQVWVLYDTQPVFSVMSDVRTQR